MDYSRVPILLPPPTLSVVASGPPSRLASLPFLPSLHSPVFLQLPIPPPSTPPSSNHASLAQFPWASRSSLKTSPVASHLSGHVLHRSRVTAARQERGRRRSIPSFASKCFERCLARRKCAKVGEVGREEGGESSQRPDLELGAVPRKEGRRRWVRRVIWSASSRPRIGLY